MWANDENTDGAHRSKLARMSGCGSDSEFVDANLGRDLAAIPVVDGHCHPIHRETSQLGSLDFRAALTESRDDAVLRHQVVHGLHFQRAIAEMAELLETDPTEEAVLWTRASLGTAELLRRSLGTGNIRRLVIDEGFQSDTLLRPDEQASLDPACAMTTMLRVETRAEQLLAKTLNLGELLAELRQAIREHRAGGGVGLKSIIAYRSGLAVEPPDMVAAMRCFDAARRELIEKGAVRLTAKPLLDVLFRESMQVAALEGLPVQIHTGFGDTDLDLRLANPLHLRPIFEERSLRSAPVVMLHCYPFVGEAAYLASVYPNAYVDLSQTIPHLSYAGHHVLSEAFGLAPASKVMYGSDAHTLPELYAIGAGWARRGLARVLRDWINDGMPPSSALRVAHSFLASNATALYAGASDRGD